MIRAHKVVTIENHSDITDAVTIDRDGRFRRRIALTGENGTRFLLDLPQAVALKDGDGLELEDGRVVLVRAAEEELLEITARDPHHLARLAWHVGNRHIPCQILPDLIRIKPDHVIKAMIIGLGGLVRDVRAPFDPESGAYAGHHPGNGHDHHHDHHD